MSSSGAQPYAVYNIQRENYSAKFAFQLLFFAITTLVGLWAATYKPFTDLLVPPDEREQLDHARETIEGLASKNILGRDIASSLSTHELKMAARIVDATALTTGFEDIGGLVETKRKIFSNILIPLRHHERFLGDDPLFPRPVRGVLFSGPPGTGKTMTARAIARDSGVKFFNVSLADINDKYYGESERLLSALFSLASKVAPSVVFIDEFDGFAGERNATDQSHVYGLKTHLLTLLDGLATASAPVMVIGATNNARHLDRAMRRRMPLVIEFDLPTEAERVAIAANIVKNDVLEHRDATISSLAKLTEGFSGSDIDSVYREACTHRMQALVEGVRVGRALTQADFDAGLDAVASSMDAHEKNHLSRVASTPIRIHK